MVESATTISRKEGIKVENQKNEKEGEMPFFLRKKIIEKKTSDKPMWDGYSREIEDFSQEEGSRLRRISEDLNDWGKMPRKRYHFWRKTAVFRRRKSASSSNFLLWAKVTGSERKDYLGKRRRSSRRFLSGRKGEHQIHGCGGREITFKRREGGKATRLSKVMRRKALHKEELALRGGGGGIGGRDLSSIS